MKKTKFRAPRLYSLSCTWNWRDNWNRVPNEYKISLTPIQVTFHISISSDLKGIVQNIVFLPVHGISDGFLAAWGKNRTFRSSFK